MEKKFENFSDRDLSNDELKEIAKYFRDKLNCKTYINTANSYIRLTVDFDVNNSGSRITIRWFQNKLKISDVFFGYGLGNQEEIRKMKHELINELKPFLFEINQKMGYI